MRKTDAQRLPLGDYLVQRGMITADQKLQALSLHSQTGRRLGEVLVEMGALTEDDISQALAERNGIPYVHLRGGLVDPRIATSIPREKAELYEVLPLFRIHNRLFLAVSDPNKVFVLDIIRKLTGCEVLSVVSPKEEIRHMIADCFEGSAEETIGDLVSGMEEADVELVSQEVEGNYEDIADMAGESPIINLVNLIILKAIREHASDIHLEPERTFFRVRYRIDGILYEVMRQKIELLAPVISRMKIMANLDIAERRLPQDGRIQVMAHGHTVDLRFSSLPGVIGEKVVLRVLDREAGVLGLHQIGFSEETLGRFRALLHRPHGLVLVTGPTGSGKTTTLYAGLRELNSLEKNIVTIEDPVEYQFEIINQNQVRDEIGLTFARVLRHTLRQDPDIIMVGEIRDSETAEIAVQAALTGHLVLSTMHTNDASSSISRLLEMGIESYLLASSLIGVVGQRLVRTVCPDCMTRYMPTKPELATLGIPEDRKIQLTRGRGCSSCFDSGYRGRLGIYELVQIDHELQHLILRDPSLEEIRRHQANHDLPTLQSEGFRRVIEGKTTLEEVGRAVSIE